MSLGINSWLWIQNREESLTMDRPRTYFYFTYLWLLPTFVTFVSWIYIYFSFYYLAWQVRLNPFFLTERYWSERMISELKCFFLHFRPSQVTAMPLQQCSWKRCGRRAIRWTFRTTGQTWINCRPDWTFRVTRARREDRSSLTVGQKYVIKIFM